MMQTEQPVNDDQQSTLHLGVVIPLANEEVSIEKLLQEILVHLGPDDRIFCVLDNVSKDRTRELVQNAVRLDNRICEVWAPQNRCVVDAYFRGYQSALDSGCMWILEMDGGYSHNPQRFHVLLKQWSEVWILLQAVVLLQAENITDAGPVIF